MTMLTTIAQLTPEDLAGTSGRLVKRVEIEGIDVLVLNVPYRQTMGSARRIWAFVCFLVLACWFAVRLPKVDVLYATSTPLTVGIPALAGWWLRRRPYVFEVRDVWPGVPIALGYLRNRWAIRLLIWTERLIYRGAKAIVTASPGMEEMVRQARPGAKPIITAPNCSDIDVFHPGIDGAGVRREQGWSDRFVCMYTGAMGPSNGLDVIVRAADHFRNDPDLLFILVGEGSEKGRVLAERQRRGLDNLIVMDGVPKRKLPAVVAAADVCLVTFANVPILEHNSANKFFDSLSAGKPVLLNYSGWQREAIEAAGAGWGCESGNDGEFWAKIGQLKADPDRRAAMGRNSWNLALTRFNRDKLSNQVLDVLTSVVGSRLP